MSRQKRLAVKRQTVTKQRQRLRRKFRRLTGLSIGNAHDVLFFDRAVFSDNGFGHASVLRKHEKSHGVDVQTPCGNQASQLGAAPAKRRIVTGPAIFRRDQNLGGFVAVFSLSAHVTDRFVEKHRHLLLLAVAGLRLEFDARAGAHFLPELRHLAVDQHPALFDKSVRLAATRESQFAHAFGQANKFRRT